MNLKIGCCGFPQSRPTYFARFSVVEIQQTFYRPPQTATAQRWRTQAPPGFEFTLKAWQLITHEPSSPTYRKARLRLDAPMQSYGSFRPTPQVLAAWERTREIAQALQARVILLQCPASFSPTEEHVHNLRGFLSTVQRDGLRLAWEPRGAWPPDLVCELCQTYGLIHAVDPFYGLPVTAGTAYFRLHGRTGYGYQYTDDDLSQLLAWCQAFEEVYCLFNNITMWDDAIRFQELARRVIGS
ncbi:MAG: DUF72 domain-containing protein [Anaerolineae bacterium]|nr:DUF72 domain-containing protein [Anaerolineae bacterium]MDW8098228.1 DUF72 domain-containing protein [Anaerolineae bacterium]